MKSERVCNQCGAALPEKAADSTCPACLLEWAVDDSLDEISTVHADSSSSVPEPAAKEPLPRAPQQTYFGNYELLEEINRGGMGIVYKARQVGLNRIVAIKMILAGQFAGPNARQRFLTEAEAVSKLRHPNIVGIHEVGEHDGFQFFSMDYIEGGDLGRRLRDGPVAPTQAAEWLKTIAQAIHYAHDQGILHRDLKPSNILIDAQGQPHVTDFGLAKQIESGSEMTLSGQVLGSPNYMPPEQAEGRRIQIGRTADVYSLGAILYHLLTGRPPFIGQAVAETLHQVVHGELVSPRLLNPSTPPDLETVCLKCLEREPGRRYQTAQELADELGRFLHDEPIRARPASRWEKSRRWCRRNPVIAGLAASLVFVFWIGFAAVLWQLTRVQHKSTESRQQLVKLNVISGANLMQNGDYLKSLLWFAESLRADSDTGKNQEIHRMRIASVLQECPRLVRIISHDGSPLGHVEFSPSEDRLATIGADHTLRIWSVPAGEALVNTKPFPTDPLKVQYSPEGDRLLVTLLDRTVWLIDAATGQRVGDPFPHRMEMSSGSLFYPSIDASGQFFAALLETNVLQVWEIKTGRPRGKSMVHSASIQKAKFTPDGMRLLVRTAEPKYYAWNPETGEPVELLFPELYPHEEVWFSPSRDVALVGARLWNLQTKTPIADIDVIANLITSAAFSVSGERLLITSRDRTAQVWNADTGSPIGFKLTHDQAIGSGRFSADGARISTRSSDNAARVWEAESGRPVTPPMPSVLNAHFSPSGRYFLTIHPSHSGYLWDLHRRATPPVLLKPLVSGMGGTSPVGEALVSRESDNLVRFQHLLSGLVVSLHPMSIKTVPKQAWSDASGRFVIVEGEMATVQIWDAGSGLPLTPLVSSYYTTDEPAYTTVKLPTVKGPTEELLQIAELLSGNRLDASGGWKSVDLSEILAAWENLKGKYPGILGPSEPDLTSWHRQEAEAAEGSMNWTAAAFHWEKLKALRPDDEESALRFEYAKRCVASTRSAADTNRGQTQFIPPRDPRASERHIDLTGHYNASLGEFAFVGTRNAGLGVGLRKLGPSFFDLRGIIRVFGTESEKRGEHRPKEVRGIQVQQDCQSIHFLHSAQWATSEEQIAVVFVHYANGQSERVSIRNPIHLANDVAYQEPSEGKTVWIGTNPWANANSSSVRIYSYAWTNPHPDRTISHLDLVSSGGKASYLLFAATVD